MTLCDGLRAGLTNPGITLVYGILMSFVLDWFPAFELAAPRVKRLVVMAIALLIPLLSTLLLHIFGCEPLGREQVWIAIFAGMSWFLGSQFAHLRELPDVGYADADSGEPLS